MACVTGITFRNDRVRVCLDTEEDLVLPPEIVVRYGLEKGKEIPGEDLTVLAAESQRYRCWQKSLHYLSFRNRSVREMNQYLKKKGFQPEIITHTMARLEEYRYLDDAAFAVTYIQSRLQGGKRGINLVKRELALKGIQGDLFRQAVEGAGIGQNRDELLRIARRKLKSLEGKNNVWQRLAAYLYQRGFTRDDISMVLKELHLDHEELD